MVRCSAILIGFLVLFSSSAISESPQTDCQPDFRNSFLNGEWVEIDRAVERCEAALTANQLAESFCLSTVAAIAAPEFDTLDNEHKNQIPTSWSRVLRLRRASLSAGALPACDNEIAWHWRLYTANGDRTRLVAIGKLIKRYSGSGHPSHTLQYLFRAFASDRDAEVPGLDVLAEMAKTDPSICRFLADFFTAWRVMGIPECPSTASTAAVRLAGLAIEMYRVDHNKYPDLSDVVEATRLLTPIYFKEFPRNDGWGHELIVRSNVSEYEVRSLGADGRRQDKLVEGEVSDPNADIVYRVGKFFQQHDLLELP